MKKLDIVTHKSYCDCFNLSLLVIYITRVPTHFSTLRYQHTFPHNGFIKSYKKEAMKRNYTLVAFNGTILGHRRRRNGIYMGTLPRYFVTVPLRGTFSPRHRRLSEAKLRRGWWRKNVMFAQGVSWWEVPFFA